MSVTSLRETRPREVASLAMASQTLRSQLPARLRYESPAPKTGIPYPFLSFRLKGRLQKVRQTPLSAERTSDPRRDDGPAHCFLVSRMIERQGVPSVRTIYRAVLTLARAGGVVGRRTGLHPRAAAPP